MKPILIVLLVLAGCGGTMANYYKTVGSVAGAVTAGYQVLELRDNQVQADVHVKLATDPAGARVALQAWLEKYGTARKALDDTSVIVETAKAAGPSLEAAADRSKRVADWIVRLAKLAVDIQAALAAIGVK